MEGTSKKIARLLYHPVPMTSVDWLVDCVIAAGVFGFGLLQLTFSANLFVPDDFMRRLLGIQAATPSILGILATLAISLPLILRRRFPWPVFIATLLLWIAFEWMGGVESFSAVSPLIALFTLASECDRNQTIVAASAMLVNMLLSVSGGRSSGLTALLIVQNVALVIAVAFAGYALKTRGDYLKAAEARAAEAELTREMEASRRVEAERVRIARELHDITAHSLSAVSIQAAVAERMVDSDPEAAKVAIAEARATAKSALADMRSMVGVLRSGEDAQLEPTEGTDRMASLESYLEGAGIDCSLLMSGYDRSKVPTHVDVALFGIAREACTNIVRHSGATSASIELHEEDGSVSLTVSDNGRGIGNHANEGNGGHGIEGMRERVKLLDGRISVSSAPEGGTRIHVSIPAIPKEAAHA